MMNIIHDKTPTIPTSKYERRKQNAVFLRLEQANDATYRFPSLVRLLEKEKETAA